MMDLPLQKPLILLEALLDWLTEQPAAEAAQIGPGLLRLVPQSKTALLQFAAQSLAQSLELLFRSVPWSSTPAQQRLQQD